MDQTVSFGFFIRLVRKYWLTIVSFTVVGLIVAAGLTFFVITPKYQSSVQILVNRKNTNAATEYAGQQADIQMVTTYKQQLSKRYGIERSLYNLSTHTYGFNKHQDQLIRVYYEDRSMNPLTMKRL